MRASACFRVFVCVIFLALLANAYPRITGGHINEKSTQPGNGSNIQECVEAPSRTFQQ